MRITQKTDNELIAVDIAEAFGMEIDPEQESFPELKRKFEVVLKKYDRALVPFGFAKILGPVQGREKRTKMNWKDAERICEIRSYVGAKIKSIEMAGWDPATWDGFMARNPDAKKLWDGAFDRYIESLEVEATERGRDGWMEPIVHNGKITDYVRRKSDRILELMLRAHIPQKYRDNYHEEQKHKAEAAQIDFAGMSQDTRDAVREKIGEIRDLIAADNAKNVTPAPKVIEG